MSDPSEIEEPAAVARHPYDAFLARRDEVMRVKWVASERLGRDIGMEAALLEWAGLGGGKEKEKAKEKPRAD